MPPFIKIADETGARPHHINTAKICVEVDLKAGLPEAVLFQCRGQIRSQILDYDKVPFRCGTCHEYGHFNRSCPKRKDKQPTDDLTSVKAKRKRPGNTASDKSKEIESPNKLKALDEMEEDKGEPQVKPSQEEGDPVEEDKEKSPSRLGEGATQERSSWRLCNLHWANRSKRMHISLPDP